MRNDKGKRLIIVLGPGRSGTSILTRFLGACGMRLSEKLVGSSEQNPEGAYEDKEIFDIQSEIFATIGSSQLLPLPKGWSDGDWVNDYIRRLRDIVSQKVSLDDRIWGFKDPRTTMLLPLWIRVFNRANVTPLYLMATRDPCSVVASLNRQYGFDERAAELFWLYKNVEALYHTGGNIFISHYEDWFDRPESLSKELLEYTGLELPEDVVLGSVLENVVNKDLNRSVYTEYTIKNRWVGELYGELINCRGTGFDRDRLMRKMMQCRSVMNQFAGWTEETQKLLKQQGDDIRFLKEDRRKFKRKYAQCNENVERLRSANDKMTSEIIGMKDENDSLKKAKEEIEQQNRRLTNEVSSLVTIKEDLTHKNKQLIKKSETIKSSTQQLIENQRFRQFQVMTSYSYRIGLIITDALRHPLKGIFVMPYRLFCVALGAMFFRTR